MTILEYCIENLSAIEGYRQKDFTWVKYNKNPLNEIPSFKQLLDQIPELINRECIIQEFANGNFYKGFIMAMMWGQIGNQPGQKGDKTTTDAYKSFSTSPEVVDSRLRVIRYKIANEEFHNAYNLLAGEMKFDGIDVSFFTKLLSFISETFNPPKNLLIYDSRTKLIHIHLMLDEGLNPADFYRLTDLRRICQGKANCSYETKMIYTRPGLGADSYMNYNDLICQLSNHILRERNVVISPFNLEGYLFGWKLHGKKNIVPSNPRFWIQRNFIELYMPQLNEL
jgi:hypothetical protein